MSENRQENDTMNDRKNDPSESQAPLTKLLDEFLKDHTTGTVSNARELLHRSKGANELANDQVNPRYQKYDGRDALKDIENPKNVSVQVKLDETGRPVSFSSEQRDVNVSYSEDSSINKVTINAKENTSGPYWTESEFVGFERRADGSFFGVMKTEDEQLYPSKGPLTDFEISSKGNISYFDSSMRHRVKISMDNSVTTYAKEHLYWSKDPQPEKFETTRSDGTKQIRIHTLGGVKLTIEELRSRDSVKMVGYPGVGPSAAILDSKDGGKIVFLPHKDGAYLRAAIDPKGNMSSDVMSDKPLGHFVDELRKSKELGIKWSAFNKDGVHFTMTGIDYSLKDYVNHYFDYKRDKGR